MFSLRERKLTLFASRPPVNFLNSASHFATRSRCQTTMCLQDENRARAGDPLTFPEKDRRGILGAPNVIQCAHLNV